MKISEKALVVIKNEVPVTTSLKIAEVFEKKHFHIIRDIKNLECSEKFNTSNFGLVDYKDKKGEYRKCYNITRDGFTLLVMGFTGKRAMQFKEEYIAAFNKMEEKLKQVLPKPLTPAEMFLQSAQFMVDQEQKNKELDNRISNIEKHQLQVKEAFQSLPEPEVVVPVISLRNSINKSARNLAALSGVSFGEVYSTIYSDMLYRCSVNIKIRAKIQKISPIDYAEKNGLLPEMYAIIKEYLDDFK